jgi:hypothetical protein
MEYSDKEIAALFFLTLGLAGTTFILYKICTKNSNTDIAVLIRNSKNLWKMAAVAGAVILLAGVVLWATILDEWDEQKKKPHGCPRDHCWNEQEGQYRGGTYNDLIDCGDYPSCKSAIGIFLAGIALSILGCILCSIAWCGMNARCCFVQDTTQKVPQPVLQAVQAVALEQQLEAQAAKKSPRRTDRGRGFNASAGGPAFS